MRIAQTLQYINKTLPTIFFIRHAKKVIDKNFPEHLQPLNAQGKQDAYDLGELIREAFGEITSIYCSPIERCVMTGKLLAKGNKANITIEKNLLLRHAYIDDPQKAARSFLESKMIDIVRKQVKGEYLNGFIPIELGTQNLLKLALGSFEKEARLNICVTHDALLTALFFSLTNINHTQIDKQWMECLDGICIQQLENGDLRMYRGNQVFAVACAGNEVA